jgi:hypothetical protein
MLREGWEKWQEKEGFQQVFLYEAALAHEHRA